MENPNTSQYRLKEKYNNIPLEFGSNIFVNNNNITDEYAEKLLERYNAEKIFDVYPQPTENVVEETTQETTEATTENVEKPTQEKRTRKIRK